MIRDISKLDKKEVDVLVIGSGIHGATIAYYTAKAGYRVAIVDKNDFSHATSANSLKILHGGLRYLQHLNFRRIRNSVLARREIMRFAPHLVKPLACIMPTYGYGLRGKEIMRFALFLNDLISWDRNNGLTMDIQLPRGHTLEKEKCLRIIPQVKLDGLRGGAVWYDALAINTERLAIEYILAATENGATAANYLEVKKIVADDRNSLSIKLEDKQGSTQCTIRTRVVINAAGPWIRNICAKSAITLCTKQHWALALNIIVKKCLFPNYGVGLEGSRLFTDNDSVFNRGKRLFFFVPWRGHTMIGTEYKSSHCPPDSLQIKQNDLLAILNEINRIYPPAKLKFSDITFYHAGLLPISEDSTQQNNAVQLEKNSQIIDHEKDGLKGLITVKSVKYTTAPYVAREVVELIKKKNILTSPQTKEKNGDISPQSDRELQVVSPHLLTRYGHRARNLTPFLKEDNRQDTWISKSPPLLTGEVDYLIKEEMALKLSDIVFRRTDLGTSECPPPSVLEKLAARMAQNLGWDEKKIIAEMSEMLQRYSPLRHIPPGSIFHES